ncbi:hypothetical protein BDZ89DRAFT_1061109, partial [Hymenopellis radicata]
MSLRLWPSYVPSSTDRDGIRCTPTSFPSRQCHDMANVQRGYADGWHFTSAEVPTSVSASRLTAGSTVAMLGIRHLVCQWIITINHRLFGEEKGTSFER